MDANQILDRVQEKIAAINSEAAKALESINERNRDKCQHIQNMYDCDIDYYINVARYAWAERAKQIAMLQMQSVVLELRQELSKIEPGKK